MSPSVGQSLGIGTKSFLLCGNIDKLTSSADFGLRFDISRNELFYLDKRGWGKRERKRQKKRRRRERDNFLLLVKEQTSVSPVFVSCLCQNCSPPWIHFLQYFASRKK